LDTYQKVQRHLRGILFEECVNEEVKTGIPILVEGEKAGILTSICYHPEMKISIALGLIRRAYEVEDQLLEIQFDENRYAARVSLLPFRLHDGNAKDV